MLLPLAHSAPSSHTFAMVFFNLFWVFQKSKDFVIKVFVGQQFVIA